MILEEELKILFWAHPGGGKTTYCAALQAIGRKSLAQSGSRRISLAGEENPRLRDIVRKIRSGGSDYRPTQNLSIYNYNLFFKGSSLLWAQPLCKCSLLDFRGGDFDEMQRLGGCANPGFIKALVEGNGIGAIFLLFSLDQFDGVPLREENPNWYLHRDRIYNFLCSVHEVVNETGIPLVIAVNHCVENGEVRTELIGKAKKAMNEWMGRIFTERRPNLYFIDSIAAVSSLTEWRKGLCLPILDLIGQALLVAQTKLRSGFQKVIYDDPVKLREECLRFVFDSTNSEVVI